MILRREKQGDFVEGIEILFPQEAIKQIPLCELVKNESIKVDFLMMEGETLIYNVEIPGFLKVKPPDFRRYAYDHKKIESLIINCVNDNCQKYIYKSIEESLFKIIEQELLIALQDLNSILDVISVECQLTKEPQGYYSVKVMFEFKNGVLGELIIPIYYGKT